MIRELHSHELNQISGGQRVIPYVPLGYELVGWDMQLVGYDVEKWYDHGLLIMVEHIERTPIYDIQPIYQEILPVAYVVY